MAHTEMIQLIICQIPSLVPKFCWKKKSRPRVTGFNIIFRRCKHIMERKEIHYRQNIFLRTKCGMVHLPTISFPARPAASLVAKDLVQRESNVLSHLRMNKGQTCACCGCAKYKGESQNMSCWGRNYVSFMSSDMP